MDRWMGEWMVGWMDGWEREREILIKDKYI